MISLVRMIEISRLAGLADVVLLMEALDVVAFAYLAPLAAIRLTGC